MAATIYGQPADVLPAVDADVDGRQRAVTHILNQFAEAVWSYARAGDAEMAAAGVIQSSEKIDRILAAAEAA